MKQNNDLNLDVRVYPIENGGKVKGYASVNIAGAFAIKNLRVIQGNNGLFVAMPSIKNHKGEYEDLFFPVTKESREILNSAVLKAYEQSLVIAENLEQGQKSEPEMSM